MRRDVLVGLLVLCGVLQLAGPVGLAWAAVAPRAAYVLLPDGAELADPGTQALVAADGWFAALAAAAGLLSGLVACLAGGRRHGAGTVIGLAVGGMAAGPMAWRVGQVPDLAAFRHAAQTLPDGARVTGFLTLTADSVLVVWPLFAVAVFGLLVALSYARLGTTARRSAGDGRDDGVDEPDEVGAGQLDLQPAPSGRDEDRAESQR